jgi:hypothetical protein
MTKPPVTDPNCITHHASGGMSVVGPDAMLLYKAVVLKNSMQLYVRTGIRPTRGVGPKHMTALASQITGRKYKPLEMGSAIAGLERWIATMKAAIPVVDERKQAEAA